MVTITRATDLSTFKETRLFAGSPPVAAPIVWAALMLGFTTNASGCTFVITITSSPVSTLANLEAEVTEVAAFPWFANARATFW
ncbi:hypothetical protein SDC9_197527 [bioreactor metagenome]|uniref:Uncharacterized protein n=1 Tax=bioreactor metagenome TaxID=1076179 RepID=A0A645IRJ8_9ZZZZ